MKKIECSLPADRRSPATSNFSIACATSILLVHVFITTSGNQAFAATVGSAPPADAVRPVPPNDTPVAQETPTEPSWDRDDFAMFDLCFGGPNVSPFCARPEVAAFCIEMYDLDEDGDVDLRDAAAFQAGMDEPRSCDDDSDCIDDIFCNGEERCEDGFCRGGCDPCPGWTCHEDSADCSAFACESAGSPFCPGQPLGTLEASEMINEASGLVASRKNQGVLWTHNDNWGDNRLFAISKTGQLLGSYTVGIGAIDPEDIAIGPGPEPGVDYLYWGDIGDNDNLRPAIFVKRVVEPYVHVDQPYTIGILLDVAVITLKFPDGSSGPEHKDAETMLVDPLNGDIYIITKRVTPTEVFRAAYPHSTSLIKTLQRVATIPWAWATGGDVSPDGTSIIIRRYSWLNPPAAIWYRTAGSPLWEAFNVDGCDVELPADPQGEAIAWDQDGRGFLTVSEDDTPDAEIPVWYVPTNRE